MQAHDQQVRHRPRSLQIAEHPGRFSVGQIERRERDRTASKPPSPQSSHAPDRKDARGSQSPGGIRASRSTKIARMIVVQRRDPHSGSKKLFHDFG